MLPPDFPWTKDPPYPTFKVVHVHHCPFLLLLSFSLLSVLDLQAVEELVEEQTRQSSH